MENNKSISCVQKRKRAGVDRRGKKKQNIHNKQPVNQKQVHQKTVGQTITMAENPGTSQCIQIHTHTLPVTSKRNGTWRV